MHQALLQRMVATVRVEEAADEASLAALDAQKRAAAVGVLARHDATMQVCRALLPHRAAHPLLDWWLSNVPDIVARSDEHGSLLTTACASAMTWPAAMMLLHHSSVVGRTNVDAVGSGGLTAVQSLMWELCSARVRDNSDAQLQALELLGELCRPTAARPVSPHGARWTPLPLHAAPRGDSTGDFWMALFKLVQAKGGIQDVLLALPGFDVRAERVGVGRQSVLEWARERLQRASEQEATTSGSVTPPSGFSWERRAVTTGERERAPAGVEQISAAEAEALSAGIQWIQGLMPTPGAQGQT